MNRNLFEYPVGSRVFGILKVGMTKEEIESSTALGTSGPGIMFNDGLEEGVLYRARLNGDPTLFPGYIREDGSLYATASFSGTYTLYGDNLEIEPTEVPLDIQVGNAPAILVAPAAQSAVEGQTATFSVTAVGTAPLAYQWQRNGVAIAGADSSSYVTPALSLADTGSQYRVQVSNTFGSVLSPAATLTVTAAAVAPSITTQPQSQSAVSGSTLTFSVVATGTAPLSYQWRRNGANITGATASSYTTPSLTLSDNGAAYSVVVSNSVSSVTSANAVATVSAPSIAPTITTNPQNQTVNQGQAVTFTVAATGTAPLSYQWLKNGSPIAGETNLSLSFTAQPSDSGSSYAAQVSNSAGSSFSSAAVLTVRVAPAISVQPQSQTITAGQTATFSVTANGTAPLSYQWRLNGADIAGATGASYTTPVSTALHSGRQYSVVVSNLAGSVTSTAAVLTVNEALSAPNILSQPQSVTVGEGQGPAIFTVVANGNPAPSYQWRRNGVNIPGATQSTYEIAVPLLADSGSEFSVVVSSSQGTVVSAVVTLTVTLPLAAPTISLQPVPQTVAAGQQATFYVEANGNPSPTYQWRRNGVSLPGATSNLYVTPVASVLDSGSVYSVLASNSQGSVESASVALTVNPLVVLPFISSHPVSLASVLGQSASFSVSAGGSGTLSFQWYRNGVELDGATTSLLLLPSVSQADDQSVYTVRVESEYGFVVSNPAVLSVLPLPQAPGPYPTKAEHWPPGRIVEYLRAQSTRFILSPLLIGAEEYVAFDFSRISIREPVVQVAFQAYRSGSYNPLSDGTVESVGIHDRLAVGKLVGKDRLGLHRIVCIATTASGAVYVSAALCFFKH